MIIGSGKMEVVSRLCVVVVGIARYICLNLHCDTVTISFLKVVRLTGL